VLISTEVDTTGNASRAKLFYGSVSRDCERNIIEEIQNSPYIPATHNGEYVAARYVEIFYSDNEPIPVVP